MREVGHRLHKDGYRTSLQISLSRLGISYWTGVSGEVDNEGGACLAGRGMRGSTDVRGRWLGLGCLS